MSTRAVYFVPFGEQTRARGSAEGLNRAAGFLRGEVGRALALRHAPKLEFVYDQQIENADKLTRLIDGAVKSDQHEPTRLPHPMPTGIILLDKPQGLSSNGALQRVRKAFGRISAGHVGTLDPMATGMLPVCLDEATKVIAEIESGAKCYEFTVQLGARTDTGDAEGQVVEQQPVPALDAARMEAALARLSRHPVAGATHVFGAETRRPAALRAGAPGRGSGARGAHHRNPAPRAAGAAPRRARPGLRMRQGHLHPGARRGHRPRARHAAAT